MAMHIGYEQVDPWPVARIEVGQEGTGPTPTPPLKGRGFQGACRGGGARAGAERQSRQGRHGTSMELSAGLPPEAPPSRGCGGGNNSLGFKGFRR